jgi:hypothetical protein
LRPELGHLPNQIWIRAGVLVASAPESHCALQQFLYLLVLHFLLLMMRFF